MSPAAALQDLLFPARCLACEILLGRHRLPLLCDSCYTRLAVLGSPWCLLCGIPFAAGADHLCGDCLADDRPFAFARTAFLYREPLVTLIHQLKFGRRLTGLVTLGRLVRDTPAVAALSCPDIIIPVPLHVNRLRQRGFNQSLLLARSCFPGWKNRIVVDILHRIRNTVPQTDLSGSERRQNLKNAFSVSGAERIAGRSILLIDDVVTTGSTIGECSRILRHAGAQRVEVFALARAL